ncbi:unnamed protein product [Effrenium voratum]|nr:unnamed protein product [Effrenium voratum]
MSAASRPFAAAAVWLVARWGHRIDELARCCRAAGGRRICVLLIHGDGYKVLHLKEDFFAGAVSEEDVLLRLQPLAESQQSAVLDVAVERLKTTAEGSVVFLDESAEEDWSWSAPERPGVVCLGVHEDFQDEIHAVQGAVGRRARFAQLGPVALHSSACLHLLSSVQWGEASVPLVHVAPRAVQLSCAPRAASARNVRRALPRRQPLRFLLRLKASPLAEAAAEAHQAIVAACLVSKSVYDERDTKLLLCWEELNELRSVTLDRSLLGLSKEKLIPAEAPVLEALQRKMPSTSLAQGLADLTEECAKHSFGKPVAVRVLEGDKKPTWQTQEGWPTDPPLFLFLKWEGPLPVAQATQVEVPAGSAARGIITLQHWHSLGLLSATFTPRALLPQRGEEELLEDLKALTPTPGLDVHLDRLVPFQSRVMGHVQGQRSSGLQLGDFL